MANWFIGLPVRAEQLPADVFDSLPAGLRRLAAEDLHITLAFLGGVDEAAARAAWARANVAAGPLKATVGSPGALGRPERPSAFGLDLARGGETVAALIEQWRDPLRAAAGLAAENRAARPHVTLARPPRRGGDAIRRRGERWVATYSPEAAELDLDTLALYTWSRERPRRQFRMVERVALPAVAAADGSSTAR
jgi:2'-5' RNA ligase